MSYSVWYKLVAPGTTTVSTAMTPATFTSNDMRGLIIAYKGTDLTALTKLACASSNTRNEPVHLAFPVVAGRTYYV